MQLNELPTTIECSANPCIQLPILHVHDPNHWFYLYTDEGSSFITVRDNWTEGEKYLQNANGPGNVWENNGPQVDTVIRERAGLEAEYRDLKK